jgi:hypothetical protein
MTDLKNYWLSTGTYGQLISCTASCHQILSGAHAGEIKDALEEREKTAKGCCEAH